MPEGSSTPQEVLRNLSTLEEVEARAYRRGKEEAHVEARLHDHEQRLKEHERLFTETTVELRGMREAVMRLGEEFRQGVAVTAARAQDAKQSAEKAVTTRTLIFALVGTSTAIIGAIAALH